MDSSSSSVFLEDFGQKVDLTRRIREVLVNYPEGTTVLKELIQNADDAGATKVCLCLDRRRHAGESLLSPTLAAWQGASLLAYNDAVFTEEDFVSISRIGGSSKHGQAWKTGRFGVGFNSVYHLTDLPSFVSGKYVVLFDPQGVFLPNVSAANPGKRIEYVSSSAISLYTDQFFPYCAFGCDMKSPFNGTLFRFPLRNADQASNSKLSRQAYSEDDVSSMFGQLYEEGVFSLLFLKSVLCVEMYVWDVGETAPSKVYSCSVNSSGDDIISHRQLLLRLSKLSNNPTFEMDSFMLDFVSEAVRGRSTEKKTDTYYIVQAMASASSRIGSFAAKASKEYDIHLLPWASIAACISDDSFDDDACKNGRAFCFLPLPVRTGLSVQVNGYFEVSSNRRGIWYGADMDRSGKVRSVWNRLLLEDIIAPAFKTLLLDLQGPLGPTKLYYSLWPTGDFEEPWSILVQHIFKNIVHAPVLYSFIEGGKWVSPAESFLHDEEYTCKGELANVLLHLGLPVVRLPNSLHHMLLKCMSDVQQKVITPDSVRCFLRKCTAVNDLGTSERLLLLEYCLDDLLDSDVGRHASDLPLLPLASGDFGSFSEASKGIYFFICTKLEHELLQQISDRVIDGNLPEKIILRLLAIADSSGANLTAFKIENLVQLFDKFMPSGWRYKSKVLWEHDKGQTSHPIPRWFVTFWQYLRDRCEKLAIFDEWPILPSTSSHLYRLSFQSKMIKADKISEKLRCLLDKIGCKVLNPNYGVEHPDLSLYVSDATGPAVVESIFNIISSSGGIRNTCLPLLNGEEKDELRNFLLDPMWYVGSYMGDSNVSKCKKLPIFRVHGVESDDSLCFSDLAGSQKYLPPADVLNCFLGDVFISSSSEIEENILHRYYGLERMGKAHFYRRQVFSRIKDLPAEDRDRIMLSVLKDLPHLCIEDSLFKESVRDLEFVPTHSGASKCPGALYDPRNEELHALLEDTDLFPCGAFEEPDILDILQVLGLRTSASPETVIQSARYVEQIRQENPEKAYLRGKVLFAYVEANAHRWAAILLGDDHGTLNKMFSRAAIAFRPRNMKSDLEKFWNDLRLICWCPVLVSAPNQALPWPVVSSAVAPPKLVRPGTDLWLVSASMRILDGECSSTVLSHQLGWSSPPGGTVVAAQILELGKNNEIVTDQVFRQHLALAMPRIYARLTEIISTDEMDIVKAVLEGSRWIWVGDGFATVEEVVLNGPLHMAPYIRVIPVDLAVFKELFLDLGVREFLNFADYAKILCRMATRKGDDPLTAEELSAAILIVQHLAEAPLHEKHVLVYLPDVSGRLLPASDLVYNDAPWLLGLEDSNNSSNDGSSLPLRARRSAQRFVHGNISNDVAEKLGVCSQRRSLLAQSADSMNLSLSGAAEAFGQHEALTTRLKHILEMYADGPGILFELVQNAEDAGASEVNFLLDKTQHGTSSLLSPEMADWQGPALYCYNDSIFSPQDLYAISRIGQDSKLEKPFAIGRFGLGFNCVYHFTDIPSFVSGENIVMFDPHAKNLPGISPSHPGLRIKFVGRRILEQFPDQFSPFLYFGCDLQNHFPGTLFRFPLRTPSVAPRSQIKQEGYAPEDVLSLFSSFSQVVSETLLFLRKVKSISLYVKDGTNTEMQLVHRVQRQTVPESEPPQHSLQHMFDLLNGDQRKTMDRNQFLDKLSRFTEDNLPRRCQKVVMTENSSSYNLSHEWMLTECLGSGKVHDDSAFIKSKSHKCLPWAAVAAYLKSIEVDSGSSDYPQAEKSVGPLRNRENFDGRAFCFLPLPISTGLPVHVNAYFELSSNRRDIWFGNDMSGGGRKRSDWNIYLLEHVSAPAYAHLLEKLAMEVGPCELFLSFWPIRLGGEPWSSVVQKLYTFVADYNVRVLHTKARGGQWISAKQALFPDFSFDKMPELVDVLSDVALPLVTVPQSLVERFMEVRPSLHFLTPQLLRLLLVRRKCKFTEKHALLLTLHYCLFDLAKPIKSDCLYGLPLIPLASGFSAAFSRRGVEERIYIARQNEYELLREKIPSLLVDKTIPEEVYMKLCDIAESDDSNVSFLTPDLLEKLFLRILPIEWHNAKQVKWVPDQMSHPSVDWMKLLWSYLSSSCENLDLFSKWPILPVGNDHLMQLTRNSNIIEDEGWSENMSSLLVKVGCLFLRNDLSIEHPLLKTYVRSASGAGLLSAFLAIAGSIQNVGGLFVDASEGEMHELRSFILQSKWFSDDEMRDILIEVLRHVPMFESYRSRKLVNLNVGIKWLKPSGLREDLLNDDFVRAESEKERAILSRYLDIQELSKAEFYKCYVLNNMSELLLSQGALSSILSDVKLLVEEDVSVKSALSVTPFVLTRSGSWQQPSRVYDPRVPELQVLLHPEVFFPAEEFSDPETLDMLAGLGLKQSLGYTGLLDCARTVSLLNDSMDSKTLMYGRRLLSGLDALGSKLSVMEDQAPAELDEYAHSFMSQDEWDVDAFLGSLTSERPEEDFWSELKSIKWCPIYADPPLQGLPWLKSSDLVAAPSKVRPKTDLWMVSSTMQVLNAECNSSYIKCKLGWTDRPCVQVLSTQLVELTKSYDQLRLDSTFCSDFDAEFQRGIASVYEMMQEYISTPDFMVLKSSLEGVPWVWIGDGFVAPDALAFDSPVKYHPYLYVVPSELSSYRELLLALGVKLSFEVSDYYRVLQKLNTEIKGCALSDDQLSFVLCVLEAIADCYSDKLPEEGSNAPLLIPDVSGVLMHAKDLVFNDAPWMENNILIGKNFVHPRIGVDLASMLGVQSLRCMSLVDEEMAKDLVCMDSTRIGELLSVYASGDFLLFDLLELADSCNTEKMHVIFDKREHPRQSLLQHNLGEFQGPALLVIFEGASLSREEITALQFLPPWRLRGHTLNYGLALLSAFSVCDLLSVMSGGYYYLFDPRGLVLAPPSSHSPGAKVFSLTGTNLTERFRDQFSPMHVGQLKMSSSDMTIIRIPLSSEFMEKEPGAGVQKIKQIYDKFMEHGSRALLFLKSVLQVSLSTWEEESLQPSEDYSVRVGSSSAALRNPFAEKKWRKFQISRLFSSSNAAATKMHAIDISCCQGDTKVSEQWIIVLSMGSGQTRNMALDRRYLAYNLTPVAGIAARVSRNGFPADSSHLSCIMSPLPLSSNLDMPVTILGHFLVRHNKGRYLFKNQGFGPQPDAGSQLIEAWNKELMACIRDSYIEMTMEMHKVRRGHLESSDETSASHAVKFALMTFGDHLHSLWPRSFEHSHGDQADGSNLVSVELPKADWDCIIERVIRPFYVRLADLPVWPLYSGNLVRVEEGMFLSQPGNGVGNNLLPATVCNFVKEHYPVFSVPWDLISELQAVEVTVREIKPKMVRDLLRVSSSSMVVRSTMVVRSVETCVDVLEYCLSDIQLNQTAGSNVADTSAGFDSLPRANRLLDGNLTSMSSIRGLHGISAHNSSNSGVDALEMVSSLGKALFDFGRGVVEEIGSTGGPMAQRGRTMNAGSFNVSHGANNFLSVVAELRGLPCPTATKQLARLGVTELWVGNSEQQTLMEPLSGKFVHLNILERPTLADIFTNGSVQSLLKLHKLSLPLVANHMRLLFHEIWVNHVMTSNMAPWFSWELSTTSTGEGGPGPDWIRLFWKNFDGSRDDLSLFSDWPLIPAVLGRPVLCRVRERHLLFVPPPITNTSRNNVPDVEPSEDILNGFASVHSSVSEAVLPYRTAFIDVQNQYPWLISLLNQCNIPIYDPSFLDSASACDCLPASSLSLGQVIASKLVTAKHAGFFPEHTSFLASDCEELFNLFVSDFASNRSNYGREELEVLRALPIYKTVTGSHTRLDGQDLCVIAANSFLKPYDESCLSYTMDSDESLLLRALGISELHDKEILVRFGLPGFENKSQSEQEDILIYIYMNWQELQTETPVVDALKETHFVRNADEFSSELSKARDFFDPSDALLTSVFSGERKRFPGERFAADGWLRILRKLGLRSATEAEIMLECARRVEYLGTECIKQNADFGDFDVGPSDCHNEISLDIWSLAASLVEAVFSNFAVLYSNNFCNAFGKIACIPAERGFPNVGGKRGGRRVLSSYSDAILLKDWPLAWSCAPILTRQNVIPPEYSWGALHLKSPPSFTTVLRHLQAVGKDGGGDALAHWSTAPSMMSVEEAACEILKYLDKVWASLTSSDIQELEKVAFLPAANGTRLVEASSLFARLGVNLSPFAFELPSTYLPFLTILKELGLRDSLSISSAKGILLNLQKACGYQRLNPNELRAVMEILHFICDETAESKSDSYGWNLDAVVPDDGSRLVHARSCVYIDSYGSRFVKFIDSSRLRFIHPSVPEKTCLTLGIKKLSEVVVEELNVEVQNLECIGSVSLAYTRQKLKSRSFQDAVCKILRSVGSSILSSQNLSPDEVYRLLEDAANKLQFVQSIYTRFLLFPNYIDITHVSKGSTILEGSPRSGHRALYYINKEKTLLLVAEPPSYISVLEIIAIVLSDILGSLTPLPIGSLFLCPENSEGAVTDILRICSENKGSKDMGDGSDLIGKDILSQDASQVQIHPLRPFYMGEIVAWRSQNGEKLKYGRVPENVRPSSGQALYRLGVETSSGIIESLLSTQVFSFKSVSLESEHTSDMSSDSGQIIPETTMHTHIPGGTKRGNSASTQTGKELQYGRVAPAELVQAVHEMLSAAGVNVDMEAQTLLRTNLTLREQLQDSQAALLLEQDKAESAAKEADTAKGAWQCRICLAAEVDVAMIPCGHVLCRRCSSAVSRCPFCRLQVSKTMKIFRP